MTVLAHESFLQAATLQARIGAQPPVVEIPDDKQRRVFRNGLGDQCAELIDLLAAMCFAQTQVHADRVHIERMRSEEHTSELQSLMRISYAVFCLKKKKK